MAQDLFGGSGALNANWTVVAGSFVEGGGNAYGGSAAASSMAVYNAETPGNDHEAYIILQPRGGGDYHGPAVRCSAGAFTCANVDAGADGLYISTWAAGTQTVVAGPLTCPAAGTKITLRAVGTQLRLYFDDVEQTGSGSPWTPGGLPASGTWGMTAYNNNQGTGASEWGGTNLSVTTTIDQEGFRFGLDDGSESAHTWAADQDANLTVPVGTAVLIRNLLNGVGDPASASITLRYQKNGAGGYVPVPVGATTSPTLSYGGAGALAYSASGGTSVAPAYPANITANSGLVLVVGQKPTTANGGTCTTPSGWTLRQQNTGATDGNTGGYTTTLGADTGNTNIYVFTKDTVTGSESGTLTVTVGGNGVCWAQIIRVQASDTCTWSWDGGVGKDTSAGSVSIATGNIAITAGDVVIGGMVIPTDVTTPAQFSAEAFAQTGTTFGTVTEISEPDSTTGNDIGGFLCVAPVSSGSGSGAVTLTATAGGTTTNVRGPGFVLRARVAGVANQIYVEASSNIAAGGEATTARLTPPSGKTTADFVVGRRWDDENGADSIDITVDDYTEIEWAINTQSPAVNGDYFDFRVYAGSTALDTYTVTPRLTLGAPAPVIDSVSSATPAEGSTLTITGSNFQAAQGAGGVAIGGVAQVETSWADTSVAVTVSKGTTIKNGVAVNVVLTDNDAVDSNAFALTSIQPPSGWQYVDIGTPDTTASNRLTATPDLASGDQVEYGNIVGTGSVTVFDDGTFVADAGVTAFDFRVFTAVDGWGASATQTVGAVTTTISGGIAAGAASGQSAAISLSTSIAGGVGAAAASGLPASVQQATSIAGGVGFADASGLPASVSIGTAISAGVGIAVASGLQASIPASTAIAAGVGAADASGLAVSIRPATAVAAQVGGASASGLPATIALTTVIGAGVGNAEATGPSAVINIGLGTTIAGGTGAAVATGQTATIVTATVIAAGVAAAEAAGLGAQIVIATSISAATGTAAADGLPASISSSSATVIAATTGQAEASGLQSSFSVGTVISGVIASASAEGLAAGITVQVGAQISAGVGEASASGLPALLSLVELVDPSTFWRYDVPGLSLRHDIPAASLRFDVPSIGSGITIN